MSAPSRLIDELDAPEERALLQAAIEDVPPEGMLDQALLKAGLGASAITAMTSGAATSTAVAAGSASVASGWLGSVWAKIAIGVGIMAAANVVRVTIHTPEAAHPKSALLVASTIPPPEMPASATAIDSVVDPSASTVVEAPIPEAPVATQQPSGQQAVGRPSANAKVPETAESISDQTAAIDGARRALDRGDPNAAIGALDRYDHDFPRGAFGQEATALRVQALLRRGDRAAAAALGRRFLAAHPRSPLARRIESMLHPASDPR